MVDRIDGPTPGQTRKPDANKPVGAPQQSPSSSEPVQDSSAAGAVQRDSDVLASSVLKRAEAELATAPEVDRERVNRIKEAIASGEFTIDPERVAKAFIELESILDNG